MLVPTSVSANVNNIVRDELRNISELYMSFFTDLRHYRLRFMRKKVG